MFIYCISVGNMKYIGFDTKPTYKKSRWRSHQRAAQQARTKTKLHTAMKEFGVDRCEYEILEEGFDNIVDLAIAEISYIKKYDTKNNGLNSTYGGDGYGHSNLRSLSEEDIQKIKSALGDQFREYNKSVKWADTTKEERKELTKHLHCEEVYKKKSKTLKKYYEHNPSAREEKGNVFSMWAKNNKEKSLEIRKKNGRRGAEKVSKPIIALSEDGVETLYPSKSEFRRSTGLYCSTVISYTKKNLFYKGYKCWEYYEK